MSENIPTYKITLVGSPNSCVIKICKTKFRSLVDTGAEVFKCSVGFRVCSNVDDFNSRNLCLTAKLLKQGYRYYKI